MIKPIGYISLPISFILGVSLASFVSLTWLLLLLSILFAFILGSLPFYSLIKELIPKNTFLKPSTFNIFFILLIIIFFCFGLFWFYHHSKTEDLNITEGIKIEISGTVAREPQIRKNHTQYHLKVQNFDKLILVTAPRYPKYSYGDELKLYGDLERPPVFQSFDYRAFLQKEGISFVMYYPEIILLTKDNGSVFKTILFNFKEKVRDTLYRFVPYPHNTIIGAMTLGDGYRVPVDISDIFSRTGIRHITAISGMHITIIIGLLMVFFSSFLMIPRNISFYILGLFLITYVIFVGAPPSAIRAAITGIVILLAQQTGRTYFAGRALIVAGALMLLFNPLLLKFDVGFQLSFSAVFGIIFIGPFFREIINRFTIKFSRLKILDRPIDGITSILAITLSAHLTTLPLIIYNFQTLSIVAPLTNILVVPLVPFILLSGFLILIGGTLLPFLGYLLALPAYILTSYTIYISQALDSLPNAHFTLEINHWAFVLISYLILITVVFILSQTRLGRTVLNNAVR